MTTRKIQAIRATTFGINGIADQIAYLAIAGGPKLGFSEQVKANASIRSAVLSVLKTESEEIEEVVR